MRLQAPQKIRATIECPPDKSTSQRAAILSLLNEEEQRITNYSTAADPQSALSCVEKLGAQIERYPQEDGTLHLTIKGRGRLALSNDRRYYELDCGNSGTAMRLLSGVIAGAGLRARLIGDASLQSRTMKRIIEPLNAMQAKVKGSNGDYAPLEFQGGTTIEAIEFVLPVASAQLKSCILLAGLFSKEPVRVFEKEISRDHTERMLGIKPQKTQKEGTIHYIESSLKTQVPNMSGHIPADFSAAAFWLVAGAIHPDAEITIPRVGMNTTRNAALNVLQRMGADIMIRPLSSDGEPLADLTVKSSKLKATHIEAEEMAILIDEIPVLSIAMACAEGKSEVRGAEELRHKETDRIAAILHLLQQAKVPYQEYEDGFQIFGNQDFRFGTANFESFHDHRIAMSAAIFSMRSTDEVMIADSSCCAISYPNFELQIQSLKKK